MTDEIKINDALHVNTAEAAKKLGMSPKRVREYIAMERISAVYLNGYYIPEEELKKLKNLKPGRPSLKGEVTPKKKKK